MKKLAQLAQFQSSQNIGICAIWEATVLPKAEGTRLQL